MTERYDRHMPLFGRSGQERLGACHVAIVGVGGLGTHVVQQLTLLGVGCLSLIDSEELAETDRNRYVGVRRHDPVPGMRKVDIGERLIQSINSEIQVAKVFDSVVSEPGFAALRAASHVFGCLDSEGARLILNEYCAAYEKPYIDLASDIIPGDPPNFGGRICVTWDAPGCIVCYDLLDMAEAQEDLAGPAAQRDRKAIYGVSTDDLGRSGPSVVSLNGVVASVGVMEFMLGVTGVRSPRRLLKYHGQRGVVTVVSDAPAPDCYYCANVRGRGDAADVYRYVTSGVGQYLR